MKLLSHLSIIRGIGYLLVFILCVNCKKDNISTTLSQPPSPESVLRPGGENLAVLGLSQTKTASVCNNFGRNFRNNFVRSSAELFAFDDNLYAYTRKLSSRNWGALLVLQGFGFDIPVNATIDNIYVRARKFKTGKGSIKEYYSHLVRNREVPDTPDWWEPYGPHWRDQNLIPAVEAESNYSQAGSGIIFSNCPEPCQFPYQWTAAMINHPFFGVQFEVLEPEGGPVAVYYDLVEITVEYSIPPDVGD